MAYGGGNGGKTDDAPPSVVAPLLVPLLLLPPELEPLFPPELDALVPPDEDCPPLELCDPDDEPVGTAPKPKSLEAPPELQAAASVAPKMNAGAQQIPPIERRDGPRMGILRVRVDGLYIHCLD
jgi:hypothetical protein